MDWTKIPTDLLTDGLQDWQLAAIVKYQLIYALKEEQPNDMIIRRYLTDRQSTFVRQYIDSISTSIQHDIDTVQKERKRQKLKYLKTKEKVLNSPVETPTVTPAETPKAEGEGEGDKRREKKIKKKNECMDLFCFLAIEYLNAVNSEIKGATKFKHVDSHYKHIRARCRDDPTLSLEDFKKVIESKARQKYFTDNPIYLRPKTLFNRDNFFTYLDQVEYVEQETGFKDMVSFFDEIGGASG